MYDLIAGGKHADWNRALSVAEYIEDVLTHCGWPTGEIVEPEKDLAKHLGTGCAVVRQALRLLEMRGVGTVRRGTSGGLILARPSPQLLVSAMSQHLRWLGLRHEQIAATRLRVQSHQWASSNFNYTVNDDGRAVSKPLALLLAVLSQLDRAEPDAADELSAPDTDYHTHQQAIYVANLLAGEITYARCVTGYRLGSLSELSYHYGVGLPTFTQSVRLLADFGVLKGRRGKSGGLFLQLPKEEAIVRRINSQLLALQLSIEESEEFVWFINTLHARAAAERAVVTAGISAAMDALAHASGECFQYYWTLLQREIAEAANIPVLHMFVRCFAAYNIRAFRPKGPSQHNEMAAALQASRDVVNAIANGEPANAEIAQSRCHEIIENCKSVNRFVTLVRH